MQTIIKWKTGVFHADPEKCYEEITGIGDEVTPEQVLEKATDKETELHKCINWDDTDCARRYRIIQCRDIMRSLIVITKPDPEDPNEQHEPVQFRLLMKNETTRESGYKQTIVMVRDEDEYKKLLEQAYAELRAFKQKYSCLSELSEILNLIN